MILIKPLSPKAYDRRASGDCGTSGMFYAPNLKIQGHLFFLGPRKMWVPYSDRSVCLSVCPCVRLCVRPSA